MATAPQQIAIVIPLKLDTLCIKLKYSIRVNGVDYDQDVIVGRPANDELILYFYTVDDVVTYFAAEDIVIVTIKQGAAYTSISTVTYSVTALTITYTIPIGFTVVTKPSNPTVAYTSTLVKNQNTLALAVNFTTSAIDSNATHFSFNYIIDGPGPTRYGGLYPLPAGSSFATQIDRIDPSKGLTADNILQAGMTIAFYITIKTADGKGSYLDSDETAYGSNPVTLAIPAPAIPVAPTNGTVAAITTYV